MIKPAAGNSVVRAGFMCCAVMLICACCGAGATTRSSAGRQEADMTHIVKWQGETLAVIAKWYTGSAAAWTAIARANPAIKPNRLMIGDAISIPAGLVKNRKPLTEDFVRKFNKPAKADQKSSTEKPEPEAGPVLFGPKTAPLPQQ